VGLVQSLPGVFFVDDVRWKSECDVAANGSLNDCHVLLGVGDSSWPVHDRRSGTILAVGLARAGRKARFRGVTRRLGQAHAGSSIRLKSR